MTNAPTQRINPNPLPYEELERIAYNMAVLLRTLELVQADPEAFPGVPVEGWVEGLTDETLAFFDGEWVSNGLCDFLDLYEASQAQADDDEGEQSLDDIIQSVLNQFAGVDNGVIEADGFGVFVIDLTGDAEYQDDSSNYGDNDAFFAGALEGAPYQSDPDPIGRLLKALGQ